MTRLKMGKKTTQTLEIEKRIEASIKTEATVVKESICSFQWFLSAVKTTGLVLFYYCFSITLTFYNKKYISTYHYPLSITMTHLVTKFMLALIIRSVLECISKQERVTLGWGDYIKRVAPPGIASSLDIGFSNWSLTYVTISLYTMTKTTVIIFILLFSLVFKLEKIRWSLVLIVLPISGGLLMFTYESTEFHLLGFSLALSASFISGLRWTLSQMVLQKDSLGLQNPLDMMYHMQPWMILTLLPLSAPFEGIHISTTEVAFGYTNTKQEAGLLAILFGGAFIAFGLEMSEFLLVSKTSSLTLSISGIFKEILTLLLAMLINGDKMNALNGVGLVLCLSGIIVHVAAKATATAEKPPKQLSEDCVELIPSNGHPTAATPGDWSSDADSDEDRLGITATITHRTEL